MIVETSTMGASRNEIHTQNEIQTKIIRTGRLPRQGHRANLRHTHGKAIQVQEIRTCPAKRGQDGGRLSLATVEPARMPRQKVITRAEPEL